MLLYPIGGGVKCETKRPHIFTRFQYYFFLKWCFCLLKTLQRSFFSHPLFLEVGFQFHTFEKSTPDIGKFDVKVVFCDGTLPPSL